MRGSKYELKFDYQGKPVNEDEIRQVLKKGQAADSANNAISVIAAASNANPIGTTSLNVISQASNQVDNDMQSNSNMSH